MTNINNVPENNSWTPYQQQQQQQSEQMMDRRYSYGWNNRLMTSQSTSDLSNMKFANNNNSGDVSHIMCPQFQQFGFCPRNDICPFAHYSNNSPFSTHSTSNQSLYQQYNNTQQPQKSNYFLPPQQKPNKNQQQQQQQQQRRTHSNTTTLPDQDKFVDANMDDFIGKLYELCKDQNGCRFLQKKIEDKEDGEKNLKIVFNEIHSHFTELMTGKIIIIYTKGIATK